MGGLRRVWGAVTVPARHGAWQWGDVGFRSTGRLALTALRYRRPVSYAVTMSDSGPIWIRCEGSGGHGNIGYGVRPRIHCQMCHKGWPYEGQFVPEHDRDDTIARIRRGDFK